MTEVKVTGAVDTFLNVTVFGALRPPTSRLANDKLEGLVVTPFVPVPVREDTCGLFEESSVTVREPVRVPVVEG